MEERPRHDITDEYSWWCRQCKTRKSIREGSFFFLKSKLTLQKWLLLIHLWARDCPVTNAMEQAEVDTRTAIDVYQRLREVCTTKLLQTPIILGGPGIIVQIDESLFRHKPKVRIMLYGLITLFHYTFVSITEEDPPLNRFGCLEWSTHPTYQHWAIWKLYRGKMLQHCSL